MAITAHFEFLRAVDSAAAAPREPRRALRLEALGATASDDSAQVLLHNISAGGLLIETDAPLADGECIEVDLPLAGVIVAHVVWSSGRLHGCRFDTPVSTAVLNATQLRSVAQDEIQLSGETPAVREGSFGVRLKRLRKDRGLTLAQIADTMGVSKPTVWAWEQGKAHPIESRLEALAGVLGVTLDELQGGGARDNALGDFLAHSRERIAQAVGTTPDKIRIMIEL